MRCSRCGSSSRCIPSRSVLRSLMLGMVFRSGYRCLCCGKRFSVWRRLPEIPAIPMPLRNAASVAARTTFSVPTKPLRWLSRASRVIRTRVAERMQKRHQEQLTKKVPDVQIVRAAAPQPRPLSESEVRDFFFIQWAPAERPDH